MPLKKCKAFKCIDQEIRSRLDKDDNLDTTNILKWMENAVASLKIFFILPSCWI